MSIHDGHRKRLRQRFLQEGLEHFTDVQVLELVLFYAISRQDTNPIAHALLDHFGSLSQVMDAPVEELCKVEGIGENTAAYLHLITQVGDAISETAPQRSIFCLPWKAVPPICIPISMGGV